MQTLIKPQRNVKCKQVLAITGGKGGVGKTNVAVNLGASFSRMGKQVYLFDADFGLSNVDILLGLKPKKTIANVLKAECALEEILLQGPFGLQVIPGASGLQEMVKMDSKAQASIIPIFDEIVDKLDILIVDTAAGISDSVIYFSLAAQEIIVVITDEPTSLMDSYGLIKILNLEHGVNRFRIVVNMVQSLHEARHVFNTLCHVTEKYLDVVVNFLGWIPEDVFLKKSVKMQQAVIEAFPSSKSAQGFVELAEKLSEVPLPSGPKGYSQFFSQYYLQHNLGAL